MRKESTESRSESRPEWEQLEDWVRQAWSLRNGQAVYPLSEQDGLKAQERRYTAHEDW